MENIILFLLWTLILYVMHVLAHRIPFLWHFHSRHHQEVTDGTVKHDWKFIFLFIENNWQSTIDQWLIEIVPTILFCVIFNCYWLLIFYYLWTALIQERIRHNSNFNIMPLLTSGKYHLIHHIDSKKNYGVYVWFWDYLFGTISYDYRK